MKKCNGQMGRLSFSGFVEDPYAEITMDRIECKFEGSLFPLQPKIIVSHPQILISSTSEKKVSFLPFALPLGYRTHVIEPSWEITNGVLQLPTGGRFYFSMSPGVVKESIGDFVFLLIPTS